MNPTDNTNHISASIQSMMDIDNSTCTVEEFRGRPSIVINKKSRYPFSFCPLKAALIVKHMDEFKAFVAACNKQK